MKVDYPVMVRRQGGGQVFFDVMLLLKILDLAALVVSEGPDCCMSEGCSFEFSEGVLSWSCFVRLIKIFSRENCERPQSLNQKDSDDWPSSDSASASNK